MNYKIHRTGERCLKVVYSDKASLILDKILGKNEKFNEKLTGTENCDAYFCAAFDFYY